MASIVLFVLVVSSRLVDDRVMASREYTSSSPSDAVVDGISKKAMLNVSAYGGELLRSPVEDPILPDDLLEPSYDTSSHAATRAGKLLSSRSRPAMKSSSSILDVTKVNMLSTNEDLSSSAGSSPVPALGYSPYAHSGSNDIDKVILKSRDSTMRSRWSTTTADHSSPSYSTQSGVLTEATTSTEMMTRPSIKCQKSTNQKAASHMWRNSRTVTVPLPLTISAMCMASDGCRVSTFLDQHVTCQQGDRLSVEFLVSDANSSHAVALTLHNATDIMKLGPTEGASGRCHPAVTSHPVVLKLAPNTRAIIASSVLQPGINKFDGRVEVKGEVECFVLTVHVRGAQCGLNNACSNHGHCLLVASKGQYRCSCCDGWTGRHCQLIDRCASVRCHSNSSAHPACPYDTCQCRDVTPVGRCGSENSRKTSGTTEVPPTPGACASSPCQHGATCHELARGSRFYCHCARGYVGDTCATRVLPLCTLYPCQNEATCTDLGNTYHCACTAGYTGHHCELAVHGYRAWGADTFWMGGHWTSASMACLVAICCLATILLTMYPMRHYLSKTLSTCVTSSVENLHRYDVTRRLRAKKHLMHGEGQQRVLLELGVALREPSIGRQVNHSPVASLPWPSEDMSVARSTVHLWHACDSTSDSTPLVPDG